MSYSINYSKRFEKDMKRCKKRGCDMSLIGEVMQQLSETGSLPASYHPHKLSELWKDYGNVISSPTGC